ncbi:hypothetical protein MHU86_1075 [Fragilaria crotonensis]|nr:hypothetical protein MHU86_1075 [Fragilaria crotonensis]
MDPNSTSGVHEARSLSATESWPDAEVRERERPSLAEHFAKSQLSVADEQKQKQQQQLRSEIRGGTRSLVGGSFPVSLTCDEDIISVDSASLFGTSFAASLGDHSVATRSSTAMEYSEDDRSERGNRSAAPLLTTSLLGDVRIAADSSRYSHFLVDREFDADAHSVLTASTDQASLFADDTTASGGDAYFSQHRITPPRSLLRMNRPLNRSIDEDDDEHYADEEGDDGDYHLDMEARWILESSDTDHVYEDEDESSNNFSPEPLVDDDESTIHGSLDCSNKYHVLEERIQAVQGATTAPTTTAPVLDWSAYNQERGRFLAHQLISKARQQRHPNDSPSPHTPSTLASAADVSTPDDMDDDDDDDDEDARRNRPLTMFRNPFVRRRRFRNPATTTNKPLDATYIVVDATIRDEALATTQTNDAADLEGALSPLSSSSTTTAVSPLTMNGVVLEDDVSRASSLSDSLKENDNDEDDDDSYIQDANDSAEGGMVDSSNLECPASHHLLPEGLLRRATVDDIIDQLGLGSQGWSAIQQLRDLQQQQQPNSTSCCNDNECPTNSSSSSSSSLTCKDPTTIALAPPSCRISIQGHSIPNYPARIQWSVSNYRRHVLDLSDEQYAAMLEEEEKELEVSPPAEPTWPVLLQTR